MSDENTLKKNEENNFLKFQDQDKLSKIDDLFHNLRNDEEENFIKIKSDTYKIPYMDLKGLAPEPDALKLLKEEEARKNEMAIFKQVGNTLYVAMYNPDSEEVKNILGNLETHGSKILKFLSSHKSLEHVWSRYADILEVKKNQEGILDVSSPTLLEIFQNIKNIEDLKNTLIVVANESKNFRISRIIEVIVTGALHFKVSDIHIEPEKEKVKVRYRIDGELADICFLDIPTMRLVNSRFKLLSGLKLSTTKDAQDGRFTIYDNKTEIEVRVSLIPGNYGESFVMRLLDPRNIMAKIESLGMSDRLYDIVERCIEKPNGIILTTGPTGSGKTTTLYAFINKLHTPEIKIITIEDPVEYHIEGITQTQVDEKDGYTFLSGLRAAMRQDPDIMLVGEIRDEDTAKVAINAALTGHLVFSTLHTNSASGAIPRLLELGANPGILASALSLSLAQRLVRKLCQNCKKEINATDKQNKIITNILGTMLVNHKDEDMFNFKPVQEYKFYEANNLGCSLCHGGYKGRMGIFEAIIMDRSIADLLSSQDIKSLNERKIKDLAILQRIPTMREDGIIKVLKGETSMEELSAVVDLYEE